MVSFDLENMPKLERKAAPPKQKKEKAKGVAEGAAAAVVGAVEKVKDAVVSATPGKKEAAPKEKKEKMKMRGKGKSLKRYLRKKRKNVIDPSTVSGLAIMFCFGSIGTMSIWTRRSNGY